MENVAPQEGQGPFDIVIVGGGMVGSALACALGETPLRIALLEARPPGPAPVTEDIDLRVSALTIASQRILQALHVWDHMPVQRLAPFRRMQVWDAQGSGSIGFDCADIGAAALGHIVENRVILAALWTRLHSLPQVQVIAPAVPMGLITDQHGAQVALEDGRMLRTRLVVGADGGDSPLRGLAGIRTRGWSYDQRAVVATVRTEHPHADTAWQRFLAHGPLAFLPLFDGRCSIVWSTTPRRADALLEAPEEAFLAELEEASGGALGRMLQTSPRAAFPLRMLHARQYVLERVALCGDAAHTIHPLAGQGVNLGLLDAAALAQVLQVAARAGRDIGGLKTLRRYERWRKTDNVSMMAVMDGFKRLFGIRWQPVPWIRNFGLGLTDRAPPIKNAIMRRAMGLTGDLPDLARGLG